MRPDLDPDDLALVIDSLAMRSARLRRRALATVHGRHYSEAAVDRALALADDLDQLARRLRRGAGRTGGTAA